MIWYNKTAPKNVEPKLSEAQMNLLGFKKKREESGKNSCEEQREMLKGALKNNVKRR